jgi:hypothetical protein
MPSARQHNLTMQHLEVRQINWTNIFDHPSEFTRIDEHLRTKFLLLKTFSPKVDGWTLQSGQENFKHQMLIHTMRSYLYQNGIRQFNCQILSQTEKEALQASRPKELLHLEETTQLSETNLSEKEFMVLTSETADRLNSCQFYRKLISEIIGSSKPKQEKKYLIEAVVSNYRVCLL